MKEIMDALVKELNEASAMYYNGWNSFLTDAEWDEKFAQLKKLEAEYPDYVSSNSPTNTVGAVVLDKINEVKLDHPMLSLDKCHSASEVVKFSSNKKLISMAKLDGLSLTLRYEDGNFVSARTRGNGEFGSDVTEHVKQFLNVPMKINVLGTFIADGEAIITEKDFNFINKDGKFKNPRNTAAGSMSQLDTSVVKERRLTFVAWDVINSDILEFDKKLLLLSKLGFTTTPFYVLEAINEEKVDNSINFIRSKAAEFGYPIDGVVFKYIDVKYGDSLGKTSHHFLNGVAWKPERVEEETELIDIEWSMGKVGDLTPVAIFKDVELDGTTVSRASLHNISVLVDTIGVPFKGQKLKVYKANMIIPQVSWGEEIANQKEIPIPEVCPVCGGKTEVRTENKSSVLYCANPSCQGKLLGRFNHFVSKKAMDIDGLSESTLEFLINNGWINKFKHLYCLNVEPFVYTWKTTDGFGEKSVNKILAAIEASRNTTLEKVITAVSIPNIGSHVAKDISKLCDGRFEKFKHYVIDEKCSPFTDLIGFGEKMLDSMKSWAEESWDEFEDLVSVLNIEVPVKETATVDLSGKTFVITGSVHIFKNRDAFKEYVESCGGKVAGSVSKNTTALVNNDKESNSSKNKKAKDLGVLIMSEEDFVSQYGGK